VRVAQQQGAEIAHLAYGIAKSGGFNPVSCAGKLNDACMQGDRGAKQHRQANHSLAARKPNLDRPARPNFCQSGNEPPLNEEDMPYWKHRILNDTARDEWN
jgi:hypothetical protein